MGYNLENAGVDMQQTGVEEEGCKTIVRIFRSIAILRNTFAVVSILRLEQICSQIIPTFWETCVLNTPTPALLILSCLYSLPVRKPHCVCVW